MVVRGQAKPSVKTQNRADLIALKESVEAGKVTPVIDGTFTQASPRPSVVSASSTREGRSSSL